MAVYDLASPDAFRGRLRTAKPRIYVTITDRQAEAVVFGCLNYELARDWYDPYDVDSIRRSARWLRVSATELYDLTLQARVAVAA